MSIEFSIIAKKTLDAEYRKLVTGSISLEDAIGEIKSGKWAVQLAEYRRAKALGDVSKEDYLPAILPTVLLSKYVKKAMWTKTDKLTGLLHFDLDNDFDNVAVLKLLMDSYDLAYAFTSPNGGLKFAIMTDIAGEINEDRFKLVWHHYRKLFNGGIKHIPCKKDGNTIRLVVDTAVSAMNSQCYLTVDPDAYVNSSSQVYDTSHIKDKIYTAPLPVDFSKLPIDWESKILSAIQQKNGNVGYQDRLVIVTCGKKLGFNASMLCSVVDNIATLGHSKSAIGLYKSCSSNTFDNETAIRVLSKWAKISIPINEISTSKKNSKKLENYYTLKKREKLTGIWDKFNLTGIVLLDSPTNSGKTWAYSKAATGKRIMVAPNRSIIEQTVSNHPEIARWYGDDQFPHEAEAVVATFDKLKHISSLIWSGAIDPSEYHLFIDEVHVLYSNYSFRKSAMNAVFNNIKRFKNVTIMSGTFHKEFFDIKIDRTIKVEWEKKKKRIVDVISTNSPQDWVLDNVSSGDKTIIWFDDKKRGQILCDKLEEQGTSCQLYNADNQEHTDSQELLRFEQISSDVDVLIMTSIGIQGININNQNIDNIICYQMKSSVDIVQLHNRARKCSPKLTVLRPLSSDVGVVAPLDLTTVWDQSVNFVKLHNNLKENNMTPETKGEYKSYVYNTLRSIIESPLKWIVHYKNEDECFTPSKLGLGAYCYQKYCTDERQDLEFFEKNLKRFGYDPEWQFWEVDTVTTLSTTELKAEERQRVLDQLYEIVEKYPDEQSISDFADDMKRNKNLVDELSDAIFVMNHLMKHYDYSSTVGIILDGVIEKSLNYAYDVSKGNLVRELCEKSFKVGEEYLFEEVYDLFESNINPELKKEGYELFPLTQQKLGRALGVLFNISKKREGSGERKQLITVESFNPTAFPVAPVAHRKRNFFDLESDVVHLTSVNSSILSNKLLLRARQG